MFVGPALSLIIHVPFAVLENKMTKLTKTIEEELIRLKCPGLMDDDKTCFHTDSVCPWKKVIMPNCELFGVYMINKTYTYIEGEKMLE